MQDINIDFAIVGGGIAGLTAANEAARRGLRVTLFERSERGGGRAISVSEGGFTFNLGPHALYDGHFRRALDDFGVHYTGAQPTNYAAERAGRFHRLPIGPGTIVTSRLLGARDRVELLQLFMRLMKAGDALGSTPVADWVEANASRPRTREVARALFRFAAYANMPGLLSMDAIAGQVAAGKVLYIDGGWQTLVEGLRAAALQAGITIRNSARVERVRPAGRGYELMLPGGERAVATTVLLAVEPATAANLVDGLAKAPLTGWARAAVPARAATLDVALARLPVPRRPFALGIDTPRYFSVHSAFAKLAPEGAAAASVARYLEPGEDGSTAEASLEAMLDSAQPGWREQVIHRRFMPALVVANDIPQAARGGLAGRPGPEVPDAPGLFVAGDWVGPEGMLSDAATASARAAAARAAAFAASQQQASREPVSISA